MMTRQSDQMTGVILAGGRNSRFGGKDKAFIQVDGVPMVELVAARLREAFDRILIVTNTPGKYTGYPEFDITGDTYRNTGPLGGIHAAMIYVNTPGIFVVSCDMPYLNKELIGRQMELFSRHRKADAVIPRINFNIEPLHAIYSSGLADRLGEFLSSTPDYSIRSFLSGLEVVYMDLPPFDPVIAAFRNINAPGDFPGAQGRI